MDKLIYIESENLLNQVLLKLDKLDNGFTKDELDQIKDLVINCDDEEFSGYKTLKELSNFDNLEDLTIRNNDVLGEFIEMLLGFKKLKSLTFDNCEFRDLNPLAKLDLTSISFKACSLNDCSFITNYNHLEELCITKNNVKMSDLNKLSNLKYLQLSYSNIEMDEPFNLVKITDLLVDNTNINDFSFLNKLNELRTISIDKNQYNSNYNLFSQLEAKGINVLDESIVSFKGKIMNHNYLYKYKVDASNPFDINRINNYARFYSQGNILVDIPNTRGITPNMIRMLNDNVRIRIAGGYDDKHLADYANTRWGDEYYSETTNTFMYESVIYTKNEAIKILQQLEKLESGIKKAWTPIQQIIYTYEYLKKDVMYDPKYKKQPDSEVRSLRGLLSKKTVCAGFALMFKEVMDRLGIKCEYALGEAHAWNLVSINGKKYPIDLTWDNKEFRDGKLDSLEWFTKTPREFAAEHVPFVEEETQNYMATLSGFDPNFIKMIKNQMGLNRQETYRRSTFIATRAADKSKFLISTVGNINIDGTDYYQYFYMDVLPNGAKTNPKIFYSEANISRLVDSKEFGRIISKEETKAIIDGLLSKKNIEDSENRGTQYLGDVKAGYEYGRRQYIKKISDILKPKDKIDLFKKSIRIFERDDHSILLALKDPREANLNGSKLYRYELFELIGKNGYDAVKRNTVFTEEDLIHDNRFAIPNILLERDRLDRKENEAGGYIGYYDNKQGKMYSSNIRHYFDPNKAINMGPEEQGQLKK